MLLEFIAMLSSGSALAAMPTVKIDSFSATGRATTAAELCGHIEGERKGAEQILIVTDPKSKGPGRYIALATPNGEFCAVVSTVFGQADASLVGSVSVTSANYENSVSREQ